MNARKTAAGRARRRKDYWDTHATQLSFRVRAEVKKKLDEIAKWEDRPLVAVERVMLTLGLGVYERLVHRLKGLPEGSPTPSPRVESYFVDKLLMDTLFEGEATKWITESQKQHDRTQAAASR